MVYFSEHFFSDRKKQQPWTIAFGYSIVPRFGPETILTSFNETPGLYHGFWLETENLNTAKEDKMKGHL